MATSPLHSRGPKRGRNCYVTPTFSGVPNAKRGERIRSGCLTLAFLGAEKREELQRNPCIVGGGGGNAERGEKIRSGCLTLAFSGAEKREELLRTPCILEAPQRRSRIENQKWLPHPCLLGGPKEGGIATYSRGSPTLSVGRKSEVVTSPLPSRGPKRGRNCYITPAFTGVPNAKRGEKIRSGHLTPAFSRAQKRAELLRGPCILGGPKRQAQGENQKWLPHPCLLEGAKERGIAT